MARLKPLLMGEMKNCTKSYINANARAGSIKISLISLGPVIFGDVESIISFLRGKGLATSQVYGFYMPKK